MEECGACLRGAEGRLTSVWLRFTYLGFPNDSPGAKRCVSQAAKSERREDKKRGGTLLWLSDSWWPMGAEVWGEGIKDKPKRREKQYVNKYRGKRYSQWSLSVSFDLCLLFSPLSLLGLSALLDSNLLSTPVILNNTRLEWGLSAQQSPTCTGTTE